MSGNTFKLRDYQKNVIDDVLGELMFGEPKVLVNGVTSSGKSAMMCGLAMAHTDTVIISISISDLIDQFVEQFKVMNFTDFTVIKSGHNIEFDKTKRVIISMDNTLVARLSDFTDLRCSMLISEEAHLRIYGERMRTIRSLLQPEYEVGFTGTPFNSSGFKMKDFNTVFTPVTTMELTESGILSRLRYLVPAWSNQIELRQKYSSEYTQEDLAAQNTKEFRLKVVNDFMSNNFFVGKDVKSVWFCNGVESAEEYAKLLQAEGYDAYAFHGKMKKDVREAIMESYRTNEPIKLDRDINLFNYLDKNKPMPTVRALVSINTLTVGFSVDDIQVGVRTSSTSILNRHIQVDSRLIRGHVSKKDTGAFVMDFGQNVKRLGTIYDDYEPPNYTEDSKYVEVKNAIAKISYPHLNVILKDENKIYEVNREIYNTAVRNARNVNKRISEMTEDELVDKWIVEEDFDEIVLTYFGLMVKWYGNGYEYDAYNKDTKKTYKKTVKPFYSSNSIDFFSKGWIDAFQRYPEFKEQWTKAFKTRCRTVLREGSNVWTPAFFHEFLIKKELESIPLPAYFYIHDESESGFILNHDIGSDYGGQIVNLVSYELYMDFLFKNKYDCDIKLTEIDKPDIEPDYGEKGIVTTYTVPDIDISDEDIPFAFVLSLLSISEYLDLLT